MILAALTALTLYVHNDAGGSLSEYHRRVMEATYAGARVEISGYCYSACTLWLASPHVCVHHTAVFGFHGPTAPTPEAEEYGRALMVILYTMAGGNLSEFFLDHAMHLGPDELAVLTASEVISMGSAEACT